MLNRMMPLLVLSALAACSSTNDTTATDASTSDGRADVEVFSDAAKIPDAELPDAAKDATISLDASPDAALPDAGPCALDASSTLPGVSIQFTGPRCTFTLAEAAAGITIPYTVTVDADVSVVNASDPFDISRRVDADASGLHRFEILSGSTERYCLCDTGLPSPIDAGTGSVAKKGSHPFDFTWDGRAWQGPSDTASPEGAPFPAGTYRLEVRARGSFTGDGGATPFLVAAAFRVTLVP